MITEHPSLRLTPPRCICGVSMIPALFDMTIDLTNPNWIIVWRCPMEFDGGAHGTTEEVTG